MKYQCCRIFFGGITTQALENMGDGPSSSEKTRKQSRNKSKIFNDPIWGPIKLNDICVKIIDTPEFQRLRFVKQLGGCSFVYPGAVHTRFEHSIGTSYLAGLLARRLKNTLKPDPKDITKEDKDIICVEIAGLCHDLGHGAFSHLFDGMFIPKIKGNKDWKHETVSTEMMYRIFENNEEVRESAKEVGLHIKKGSKTDDRNFIKNLILGNKEENKEGKEKDFLYEIVSNKLNSIDVDKWDYFSRDCHMLGMKHNFQIMRSIMLARVIQHDTGYHISFPVSEYMNIFDMYHARYTLHRRAYQHPVNKAVELMITDALFFANAKLKYRVDDRKLKDGVPLSDTIKYMEAYTLVNDGVIDRIRLEFENFKNDDKFQKAKKIIDRLFKRDFYTCVAERRVIEPSVANTEAITEEQKIKKEKIKHLIDEEDIHIEPVVFNYGAGKENPMDKVKFYRGDTSAEPTYDEKSGMVPTFFQETYLRMYWKKPSEDGKEDAVRDFKSLHELTLNEETYTLKCESVS